MRAIFKSGWVRKLIGKLGVPYNRRLRVRGSPHPLNLCCRFITARSGKQRFPYPLGFALPRAFNGIVDGLGFIRRKPRTYQNPLKKFENFEAAVALNFAYYNFCKTNRAIRMTPAQAAGIESSAWTVEELVNRCGE